MRIFLILYAIILYGHISSFILAKQQPILAKQPHEVITIDPRIDGFGAHVLSTIAAFVYAELNKQEFCYRPIETIEHNYDNDPDFIAKKEELLNFIDNVLTVSEAIKNNYHIISYFAEKVYIPFFGKNIHKTEIPLKKIKKIFRANKNINNYFNNDNFNIAIHIRRPNPHDNRIYGTDIPDDIYLNIINKLRIKYNAKNPLFHIYSQGDIINFYLYLASDVILHIDESIEETYLGMVFANVLVTGRSSFSYTAGCLSDGIVYYTSYRYAPPLPHWITIEKLLSEKLT